MLLAQMLISLLRIKIFAILLVLLPQLSYASTIGNAATVQDVSVTVDVVGDDIDIALTENSSSSGSDKTTDIDIATDSDDVDIVVTHTGAGAHKTKLLCTGSCAGSDFTMSQTGANSTDVDITVTNATASDVDITITD